MSLLSTILCDIADLRAMMSADTFTVADMAQLGGWEA